MKKAPTKKVVVAEVEKFRRSVGRPKGMRAKVTMTNDELGAAVTQALGRVIAKEDGAGSMSPAAPIVAPCSILSRSALMAAARRYGIKNFRVLNKAELELVVDVAQHTTHDVPIMQVPLVRDTVAGAVKRWKAGWKANKEASND